MLNVSHLAEKMLLELPVCPLCWSDGELVSQKLNDQVLGQMLIAFCQVDGGRHLDAKCGALFRYGLDDLVGSDDVEDKTRVSNDDALDADPAHTCTSNYGDFSAMQIGSGKFGGGTLAACVQLGAQYFMYVAKPKTVKGQEGFICLAIARNAMQAQAAALFRG